MKELNIGNGTISVDCDGAVRDEFGWRQRYTYVITVPNSEFGAWQYVGNDLQSGVGAAIDETAMLGTLLSFLSACIESRQYPGGGDNADLFPEHVGLWAEQYSDEIACAVMDIEEN